MDEELSTDSGDDIELVPDLPPGQEPEEDALQSRRIKRTAVAQGSDIPLGWKPTVRNPIPVVRCRFIFKEPHPKAGGQCERWSLRGSFLCWKHSGSGNLKNVEEYRQSIIEAARLELTQSVPDALDTVLDLMQNSGADAVRLKAAESILDRGGLKTTQESNLNISVSDTTADPLSTLSERLEKLKSAAAAVELLKQKAEEEKTRLALEASRADDEVIDAEVVDE